MTVDINRKDGSIEQMNIETFARWMCFVEALDFIDKKANELKIKSKDLIKPAAIDTYIKERYDSMLHDVTCEVEMGLL
jgi:hypothetical protein